MKVAVIPARGGSKRIPGKNIKDFAGMPMIAHSIRTAKESGCFDRIIVSTDSGDIANIAREHGAECPFMRPAELANDYAGTIEVIQHAITWLKESGANLTHVCCLYATAPFVTPEMLRDGLSLLMASDKSYAFTVAAFPSAIQRALRIRSDGALEPIWPENVFRRSQDLEPAYHDAGQFYWGTAEAWATSERVHSPASIPIILPAHRVQDIDTPGDWARAEYLFRLMMSETEGAGQAG